MGGVAETQPPSFCHNGTMTTPDEARAARRAVARSVPAEWWGLASELLGEAKALDEAIESKAIRYVKTPAGARKYGEPVGSPIRPNGPKLSYVRSGPKKRTTASSAPSGGGNRSSVIDAGDTGFKPVKELTPGERGREKARLRGIIENNDPKQTGQFRERLRDIERHENELDKTVRNPNRDISSATGDDQPKPKTSPASASKPAGDKRYGTDREVDAEILRLMEKPTRTDDEKSRVDALIAERNRRKPPAAKPTDPTNGDKRYGTDKEVDKEIDRLTKVRVRSSAEQSRLTALTAERRRRQATTEPARDTPRLTREQRAATTQVFEGNPNEANVAGLSDRVLQGQLLAMSSKKKLTKKDAARAQALLAEFNRRNAEDQRASARRLVGKSADSDFRVARIGLAVKVFDLVGDGGWDCSHMTDDDVEYFLVKSLSGRPTVEKLQQASALMTERVSRLGDASVEVKELTWEPLQD